MQLAEYASYDGLGLAELVRSGQVTTRELAAAALTGIEQLNPMLNAVIGLVADPVGSVGFGTTDGQFTGVPFLIKDLGLSMRGIPCDAGSRLLHCGQFGQIDADLLNRFRASGVNIIGRTNTPEFGYSTTTEPVLHGPTHNPWNLSLSPGGSSGGGAAAVASGLVPMAHATDAGGSIRIPAAACGLVGLKPTRGRTPAGPSAADPIHGLAAAHILSRSVRDSAAMLDAVSGPSVGDRLVTSKPDKTFLSEVKDRPRILRIAYTSVARPDASPTDPTCVQAVEDVARICAQHGHHVENDGPIFGVEAFHRATRLFWASSIAASITRAEGIVGRRATSENLEAATWVTYQFGLSLTALDLEEADVLTNQVCRAVGSFFARYDVLLTPTMAAPPWPLGALNSNDPRHDAERWYYAMIERVPFSALYNMTGQPAISLPLCTGPSGVPIGVQLVARFGEEAILLNLAAQLERAMPWSSRLAPFHLARLSSQNIQR